MNKFAIISIIGSHGGALPDDIIKLKLEDIQKHGFCFWMIRSYKARPSDLQEIGNSQDDINIYLIKASGINKLKPLGNAAPTKTRHIASSYSADKLNWNPIPLEMSEVTGRLNDNQGHALVLNDLKIINNGSTLDLWNYSCSKDLDIRIYPNCSTLISKKRESLPLNDTNKSRYREIYAVGKLIKPYGVWLR